MFVYVCCDHTCMSERVAVTGDTERSSQVDVCAHKHALTRAQCMREMEGEARGRRKDEDRKRPS